MDDFTKTTNFSGYVFDGPTNFSGYVFDGPVDFSKAKFNGSTSFSEIEFHGRVDFTKAEFNGSTSFSEAKFYGSTSFSEAKFYGSTSFSEIEFHGRVDFTKAEFNGSTSFSEIECDASLGFSESKFNGSTNFSEVKFLREANFYKAEFTKEVTVARNWFSKVNFSEVKFLSEANFYKAEFTKEVKFIKTQFSKINFHRVKFLSEANFYKAEFTKEANFYKAEFTRTNFFGAQFAELADFSSVNFMKVKFTEAQFSRANFFGAQFAELADFSAAQFGGGSDFRKVGFNGGVQFSRCKFIQEASFIDNIFRLPSSFNYVLFRDPENVIFQTYDLSHVSFLHTDISRIKFGENIKWNFLEKSRHRIREKWQRVNNSEFKVLEERDIENQLKTKNVAIDIQLGDVLAVYRNLRENYEFRMRYDEAGEFFVREMEMKRQYEMVNSHSWKNIFRLQWRIKEIQLLEENNIIELVQSDWISRNISLTGLYYHLSKYGQSFSRPTIFGIGIILFSTLLWLTQPNPAADFSVDDMTIPQIVTKNFTSPEINNTVTNIEIAFERSLTNFLPSLSFGTELNVGLLDVAFKIVGGAVTFGLIIIALRRKFERKFRH